LSVHEAIDQIRSGGIAVVVDDVDRENEGDLVAAARCMSQDKVGFFLEHTSGVICTSLEGERCDQLNLPLMVNENADGQGTAFTVSTDAREGISTGISAHDRSRTITMLSDPASCQADFVRPGHVFPLRSRDGGTLKRAGHTEAAVDLARLAGHPPAGALCEVTAENRQGMASGPELRSLARRHRLPVCSVAEILQHRMRSERLVVHRAESRISTDHGAFTCHAWRSVVDGAEHLALVRGDLSGPEPVLVRIHSECVTGDVLGSWRCDCGRQLNDAIEKVAEADRGVIVYLRGHEGRGIGLAHKIAAYNLQDIGYDTVDANLILGLPVDSREYGIGAQILVELGVRSIRLMTNNPAKYEGIDGYGIEIVGRVALPTHFTRENGRYLETKRSRMGHLLPEWGGQSPDS
jgi:3,4-dihydroxy 2-butanone 4-phosphate synthase/GTP cyclohydrolase II